MRFRAGFVIGFGVGYVLGARAGRERYEQLREWWGGLSGNPRVRRAVEVGREAAGAGARRGLQAVQGGVDRASRAVRERLEDDEALD